MLRVAPPPPPDWEALLPEQLLSLPAELAAIDAYLDDERFLDPWGVHFSARLGRPSVPIPTLLRLLYLKYRYVRREAPFNRVGGKDPPPACRSRPVKLGAA